MFGVIGMKAIRKAVSSPDGLFLNWYEIRRLQFGLTRKWYFRLGLLRDYLTLDCFG